MTSKLWVNIGHEQEPHPLWNIAKCIVELCPLWDAAIVSYLILSYLILSYLSYFIFQHLTIYYPTSPYLIFSHLILSYLNLDLICIFIFYLVSSSLSSWLRLRRGTIVMRASYVLTFFASLAGCDQQRKWSSVRRIVISQQAYIIEYIGVRVGASTLRSQSGRWDKSKGSVTSLIFNG